MPSSSDFTRKWPQPETPVCMRAPPISSSVTFSPITISAIRGEPRYMEAFPSRMITTSQNAGMYAPPAALGPNSTHTCGTVPESCTSLKKIRPAWRRPGNICNCSVMRAPAESTRYPIGTRWASAASWMRRIFSTVFGPHEPAFTVGSLAISATVRPPIVPMPVTTPSAPSPSASQLARSASSVNEPRSSSSATRSRTGSLPCSAAFARWRSGPPAYARSNASCTSLMPGTLALAVRARGQWALHGVAGGLGRERAARAQAGGHHRTAEHQQRQRPPQQRVVGPGARRDEEGAEVRYAEPGRAGRAVDRAVRDQPAAGGEHDELPEAGQEPRRRPAPEGQQRARARRHRDGERGQAGGDDEQLGVPGAAAAQRERGEHARERDGQEQPAVRGGAERPGEPLRGGEDGDAERDRGDHRRDRRVAPPRRVRRDRGERKRRPRQRGGRGRVRRAEDAREL